MTSLTSLQVPKQLSKMRSILKLPWTVIVQRGAEIEIDTNDASRRFEQMLPDQLHETSFIRRYWLSFVDITDNFG